MDDLTLLYYTANKISEDFASNVRNHLLSLFPEGVALISISQKPIDFGENICVEGLEYSVYNIYKQVLIGAKAAKTKYVACCEDDSLYNREHFEHRPPENIFAYNKNRYLVNSTAYFWRNTPCMSTCIASTKLMVETLETRFEKFPNILPKKELGDFCEPGRREDKLGLPFVEMSIFRTSNPVLVFNHVPSVGGIRVVKEHTAKPELAYWGTAADLWVKMQARQRHPQR